MSEIFPPRDPIHEALRIHGDEIEPVEGKEVVLEGPAGPYRAGVNAQVIREDNGKNVPAQEYGCNLSYATIFLGTDPTIPADCKLPQQYRLDVSSASDDAIVNVVAAVVAQYSAGLLYKQDQFGRYIASPYDA